MTEFLAADGLWLLIALLVVIAVFFLLSGRKRSGAVPAPKSEAAPPLATPSLAPAPPAVSPVPLGPVPAALAAIPETPLPEAIPAAAAVSPSDAPDNLLLLKGVGPKLATVLGTLGITRFAQIAAWTDSDLRAIDTQLGTFKGRPTRDQWIDQAKYLSAGDTAGFETKYGKL